MKMSRLVTYLILLSTSFLSPILAQDAGSYDEIVYEAQMRLADKGYNIGRSDGVMGKLTEQAIRKFQQDNGLPETGKLDNRTREVLGIATVSATPWHRATPTDPSPFMRVPEFQQGAPDGPVFFNTIKIPK